MFALLLLLTYKSYRRDWIPEDPNHKNINGIDKDEGEGREYSHTRLPGHESKYFSNQTAELAHYVHSIFVFEKYSFSVKAKYPWLFVVRLYDQMHPLFLVQVVILQGYKKRIRKHINRTNLTIGNCNSSMQNKVTMEKFSTASISSPRQKLLDVVFFLYFLRETQWLHSCCDQFTINSSSKVDRLLVEFLLAFILLHVLSS